MRLTCKIPLLSILSAWGKALISNQFNLKAGSKELFNDNHLSLGSVNWAQQGRSHDLVLLQFEEDIIKWHIELAFNPE